MIVFVSCLQCVNGMYVLCAAENVYVMYLWIVSFSSSITIMQEWRIEIHGIVGMFRLCMWLELSCCMCIENFLPY